MPFMATSPLQKSFWNYQLLLWTQLLFVSYLADAWINIDYHYRFQSASRLRTLSSQHINKLASTSRKSWCLLQLSTRLSSLNDESSEAEYISASDDDNGDLMVKAQVIAAAGLSKDELNVVIEAIQDGYANLGLPGVVVSVNDNVEMIESLAASTSTLGTLGRVLVLYTNFEDEETIQTLQYSISQEMDDRLYAVPPLLRQPVLISIQNDSAEQRFNQDDLVALVENEVEAYELVKVIGEDDSNDNENKSSISFLPPTSNVLLDGATTTDDFHGTTFWDTSNLLVFDGLVNDSLRQRLLDVVLGDESANDSSKDWDDVVQGPNPNRWVRGSLSDIPSDEEEEESEEVAQDSGCWGLPEEHIDEICFQHHEAIQEFEEILSNVVFPQFHVTRLPEAVFGASVSPLTANAPTAGDTFDYHIDGDPNLTPPSPWTDIFGRYPNRLKGKPRFMSVVLYLSKEWKDEWGAPTKFLDPPTDQVFEVVPRPGRFVLADQDCRHSVAAPNESAGKRPRYSLVWKLILHPRTSNQDMMDLAAGREWPSPIVVGSAAKSGTKP